MSPYREDISQMYQTPLYKMFNYNAIGWRGHNTFSQISNLFNTVTIKKINFNITVHIFNFRAKKCCIEVNRIFFLRRSIRLQQSTT